MSRLRTVRVWFLWTLVTAICAVITLTGWLLWPAFHEYLTVKSLIEKLKVAVLEEDEEARDDAKYKLEKIGLPAVPALVELQRHSDARLIPF